MSIGAWLYRTTLRGARLASPLLGFGDSKLARGIRGRRRAVERLVRWGRQARDPARPVVWFHAPSVGEGLVARAVAEALSGRRPELQVVYTYFSPSAVAFADRFPADVRGYLPWDLPDEVEPVLDALDPAALVFTKTEVWPELTSAAADRAVPALLVGGTLPADAGRLRWPARPFLRPTFRSLVRVGAVAGGDADRFRRLGVPPARCEVTGDPGIDSASERAGGADPGSPHLRPFHDTRRPTLVAGSTWPEDEDVLVPAATRVRDAHPELRLIVAPHEPTPAHVRPLLEALDAGGWRVERLGAVEEAGSAAGVDAVVVDRVGVLAQLYTVGRVAYVGGGFGGDGLHSVLEPAAAGLPVLFGPRHRNARAAGDLLDRKAAREVAGAEEMARRLRVWLEDDEERRRAGERARRYIDEHRGAADRSAELVLEVMDGGVGPP